VLFSIGVVGVIARRNPLIHADVDRAALNARQLGGW